MAPKNRMARGNGKLDKSILCWSITPVKSCLNHGQCKDKCYAIRPYHRWPNVKNAWDHNFSIAKDGSFAKLINGQLKRSRTVKVVRIHVSGDFFNAEYINQWIDIIKANPSIKFYTYTKVENIFPLEMAVLYSLDNCNVIKSIAPDGKLNFGNDARIAELVEMGYVICPAVKNRAVACGKDCTYCVDHNKVCFPEH